MRKLILAAIALMIAASYGCMNSGSVKEYAIKYPPVKKVSQLDDYFGTQVEDPYRWLENDTSAETAAWVKEQNDLTNGWLAAIPYRDKIKARLTEIFNYPKYSSPFRAGEYYFFSKNDGLQNQSVIYYQKGLEGKPEVFLDPNKLSDDGTVSAYLSGFSKDRKYAAYTVSRSGSDWQEMYVMEVAGRKVLADKLEWLKFTGATWKGNGFYYSRYDKPGKGQELSAKNEYQKVYYHRLGDPQEKDELVYEDKAHPLRYHGTQVTEDERFLFLYVSEGTDNFEVYYKDLSKNHKTFKPLFTGFDSKSSVIDNIGDKLLVFTNVNAPRYRVVLVDPEKPSASAWKTIIPEKPELLDNVTLTGGKIFASYLKDVTTRVYQFDTKGTQEREIGLPAPGSAYGFSGEKEDTITFYTFTSFTYPPVIYKYSIRSGRSELFRKSEVKFNPEDYETKQLFCKSKDGTRVPLFVVHKKGLKTDGSNPTLLYGYGGFNISLTPSFSPSNLILLENGGIYVLANLRGGGEYGEEWHKGGMLLNKQNVFDDFIAAAEYLISEKYTSPEKLAIEGRSNGGLLVGAVINQRPDLFRVAFPGVGVMDMLRFHKFTVDFGWVDEYGSSDTQEHFKNLYAYSPLHNISTEKEYPAVLVTTADHDDRVVPAHSFKYISTLQEKYRGKNPVMIRIETKSGHGSGKSLTKMIEEKADSWAFMFYNMKMKL